MVGDLPVPYQQHEREGQPARDTTSAVVAVRIAARGNRANDRAWQLLVCS